ncbi:MAG: hypothetical protein HYV27_23860 [Candidatus Hydrogenedentes bacterium]|nr:hypothetical protein [Candidatus Hydrogenedentota bacterium]
MQPIQTRYKGYMFRSRVEAKWVVFFDRLGVRWDYESEGYQLPNGKGYLPDFKLVLPDATIVYCEVKSMETDQFEGEHLVKLRALSSGLKCYAILLTGIPAFRAYNMVYPDANDNAFSAVLFQDYPPYVIVVDEYWWRVLDIEHSTGILKLTLDQRGIRKAFGKGYVEAIAAARGARFEFGETPT